MQVFHKLRVYSTEIPRQIWKNLPKIALYGLAIYVIAFIGGEVVQAIDRQRVQNAPATQFLNYTSFTVQNAREGDDVTFTLCRTHKKNYAIDGTRTVYVVPEGKTEAQKVFIYNKHIKGVVDNGDCQSYYIRESEYHFDPGKYLITLNINFKVKYDIKKSVYAKSSIFTVYPQPDGTTDVQAQLNILQERLSDQQQLLNQLVTSGDIRTPTSTNNGSSKQTTQAPPTPRTVEGSMDTDPKKAAQPVTHEVCDPRINIFGIVQLGKTNCRQESI